MKKQILILTFFVAAMVAGMNSYGQALNPGITSTQPITPLSCVAGSEPLHPYPGQSYTYTMTAPGPETADQWTWFATKENTFIDATGLVTTNMLTTAAAGQLLAAGSNYGTATANANSIDITWSPEILANTVYQGAAGEPTFVVGYATGTNCADNIQVYEINPQFNFTIDIANIDPTAGTTMAWDATTNSCVDIVRSAVYDNTSHEITVDYGTNTLYFEVAAANFVTDFTPTFTLISGLVGVQTATVTLHASYADAQADAGVLGTTSWTTADIGVGNGWTAGAFTAANASDVVTGVSLFVKVVIENLTEESLAANPFVLAVDAIDDGGSGIWDMEDDDCPNGGGTDAADQVDQAQHTIDPRPTIQHGTTDSGTPLPTQLIPKTPTNSGNF